MGLWETFVQTIAEGNMAHGTRPLLLLSLHLLLFLCVCSVLVAASSWFLVWATQLTLMPWYFCTSQYICLECSLPTSSPPISLHSVVIFKMRPNQTDFLVQY